MVTPAVVTAGVVAGQAEHQAVRTQRVVHRESFPKKLRVPRQVHAWRGFRDPAGQSAGGAGGYRRLAHDQRTTPWSGGEEFGDRGIDVGQVGRARIWSLRRPDTEKMNVAVRRVGDGRAERQPTGFEVLP